MCWNKPIRDFELLNQINQKLVSKRFFKWVVMVVGVNHATFFCKLCIVLLLHEVFSGRRLLRRTIFLLWNVFKAFIVAVAQEYCNSVAWKGLDICGNFSSAFVDGSIHLFRIWGIFSVIDKRILLQNIK